VKNLDYRVAVKGQDVVSGNTGASGKVTALIPGDVKDVSLFAGGKEFSFIVGDLNPMSRTSGVQQRLKNLGFDCGPADGVFGPRTRNAVLSFQRSADLKPTGRIDDATRDKIEEQHDGTSHKIQAEEKHDSVPGVEVSETEWQEKDVASMPSDDEWDHLSGEDEIEAED
jgi:peptidoglycan hydrolase-like protein with peptidoglycan-binding domain